MVNVLTKDNLVDMATKIVNTTMFQYCKIVVGVVDKSRLQNSANNKRNTNKMVLVTKVKNL